MPALRVFLKLGLVYWTTNLLEFFYLSPFAFGWIIHIPDLAVPSWYQQNMQKKQVKKVLIALYVNRNAKTPSIHRQLHMCFKTQVVVPLVLQDYHRQDLLPESL